jgi:alkylhydroperoxidase family enzyme
LTPRQRALCTVAEKMTLEPRRMSAADWQPLRDLGFDDQGLLELGNLIAIFNYFPRLADGFGLLLDPHVRAAAASGVALTRRD